MRRSRIVVSAFAAAAALAFVIVVPASIATAKGTPTEYTVVAEDGVAPDAAVKAIEAAGGQVVARTDSVGMYHVVSSAANFATQAAESGALVGAASHRPIGYAPKLRRAPHPVEQEHRAQGANAAPSPNAGRSKASAGADPLDDKLWGQQMIHADDAHNVNTGTHAVRVGIIDTGLDATNPDLAPNFNWALSRNFAKDIPGVDGPCEVSSCLDPIGTDDAGHGTHVAGTVGAALNRFGLSGVAPDVSLVELKAGQDSGFFFLEPTVNALVHATLTGVDVVNMSFFVDPWLYNCLNNPADSPEQRMEQRTIITGMRRALAFAHFGGVTLVGALGNNHEDLGAPRTDIISPDYPLDTAYPRPIDNATCWDLPVEGPFVIGVSALGPSTRKADYSNYGTEQISVSAPGGWFRDGLGTPSYRTNGNLILSTYPKKVLQEEGTVDANGNIVPGNEDLVFKDCTAGGACGYYTYLQGTSMASPHAAGVASLIVSKFGHRDWLRGGKWMNPTDVENRLNRTATKHACPNPRLQTYTDVDRSEEFNAYCAGGRNFNGFYGHGIVNAFAALKQ